MTARCGVRATVTKRAALTYRGVEAVSGGVAGTTGVALVHQKPIARMPMKIAEMKPPSSKRRIKSV